MENKYEENYVSLVSKVLAFGESRETRAGPSIAMFGEVLRVPNIAIEGFPVLTTRKMYLHPIWGELAAFIHGCTKLSEFQDYGCNYWNPNAMAWPPNAGKLVRDMDVGKIYGAQWRNFNGVDQLEELLIGMKTDPFSRRHVLTTFNPAELFAGCLPPCHLLVQFFITGDDFVDCCVYMRSVDLCVGLPTDVVLYATLLSLIARQLSLSVGCITFMLGDAHVYKNHVDSWNEQVQRPYLFPPHLIFSDRLVNVFGFTGEGIYLDHYQHHDPIKYEFNV